MDKAASIVDLFNKMEYGKNLEDVQKSIWIFMAIDYIKSKEKIFLTNDSKSPGKITEFKNAVTSDVICKMSICGCNGAIIKQKMPNCDIKPLDRMKIINKLAQEIEKSIDIIGQLDIVSRGNLSRDTKREVKLLVEYLQYYSTFSAVISDQDTFVTIVNENVGLSVFGTIFGANFAAGCANWIIGDAKITPVATYLLELAYKAGVPENILKFVTDDFIAAKVSYYSVHSINKDAVVSEVIPYKIPMLIFENADIDSACDSIVNAAWGHLGTLPHAVNTLLVQENIFKIVVKKVKTILKRTKIGQGNDKCADIAFLTNTTIFMNLKEEIKEAQKLGIEVFQVNPSDTNKWQPTLIIGGKVRTNNVINNEDAKEANTLSILAFRSVDEAVALANNSKQGLAASVWTENISLANEVASKLKVGNVWINSHGIFSAEIPAESVKGVNSACFGGISGVCHNIENQHVKGNLDKNVEKIISLCKKAQEAWCKTTLINKIKVFQKLAEYLLENRDGDQATDETLAAIYKTLTSANFSNKSVRLPGYTVNSTNEPKGVIGVMDNPNARFLVIVALFEGNGVIVNTQMKSLYEKYSKVLPSNLIQIVQTELNSSLKIPILKANSNNINELCRLVNNTKNIWSNVGITSQSS